VGAIPLDVVLHDEEQAGEIADRLRPAVTERLSDAGV
jgi:hypothetical protein